MVACLIQTYFMPQHAGPSIQFEEPGTPNDAGDATSDAVGMERGNVIGDETTLNLFMICLIIDQIPTRIHTVVYNQQDSRKLAFRSWLVWITTRTMDVEPNVTSNTTVGTTTTGMPTIDAKTFQDRFNSTEKQVNLKHLLMAEVKWPDRWDASWPS